MRNRIVKTTALASAVFGVLLSVALLNADASSPWGRDYFPNTKLITQDGKSVNFYDDLIKGKIVAIDLIYTQCKDACPLETARLRQVQRILGDRVGKDIFFYSISIDPEHDTPEVLHDYAEMYNAGPGWLFLTGKKDEIISLSKKLGLYWDPNPRNRDGHAAALLIGNEKTGQWTKISATDNPRFLAIMISQFMDSYRNQQVAQHSERTDYSKASPLQLNDPGQYVFATHCAACHSIGQGDRIGPDLAGVTTRRDRGWLSRFIADPDKLLDEKDPITVDLFNRYKHVRMPNLRLADADVDAVIAFLQKQSTAQSRTATQENKGSTAANELAADSDSAHEIKR
jgi:protein SCO1/2